MAIIQPVILSGGSGTRLWPLSRAFYPKQFIRFFDDQDSSFLGATLQRLPETDGFEKPILLCNNDHRFLVREELDRARIADKAIILEPIARNTAAPIAVAALKSFQEDPHAVLVVMPSDHVIADAEKFRTAVKHASEVAASGRLVLFGIQPTEAHTGYGYIKKGAPIEGFSGGDAASGASHVDAFFEKPEKGVAESYIAAGDFYWNSGIFVMHAKTLLEEMGEFAPDVVEAAREALTGAHEDLGFLRLDKESLTRSPNISIDYAVMERTARAAMLPLDIGWSDVGSWSSLWQMAPRDAQGNFAHGDAVLHDTNNCYVHSERSLVSTIGVDNLIIVDTPDALLVANKDRSQDVSKLVQSLKASGRKEQEQHVRNYRPWGYFETMAIAPRFQVKKLHVKPGGQLSMQMHHHRSEHWVVVQGTALVTIGDGEKLVRENESVYIYATQWHRLANPGKVPLELVEVQIGTYLGEDDIIRTDDVYNRAPDETK